MSSSWRRIELCCRSYQQQILMVQKLPVSYPFFRALLLLDPRFKVESNRINQKFHVQIVLSRCGRMIFRALIIMLHQQHMVALLYPCDTFNTTIDYVLVVFPCTCVVLPCGNIWTVVVSTSLLIKSFPPALR